MLCQMQKLLFKTCNRMPILRSLVGSRIGAVIVRKEVVQSLVGPEHVNNSRRYCWLSFSLEYGALKLSNRSLRQAGRQAA